MAAIHSVELVGRSGQRYSFQVYLTGTKFRAIAANYCIFRHKNYAYDVLYSGQTGDLSERFVDHHKAYAFSRNGETHIAIRQELSQSKRLNIERDLIDAYDPPCNG